MNKLSTSIFYSSSVCFTFLFLSIFFTTFFSPVKLHLNKVPQLPEHASFISSSPCSLFGHVSIPNSPSFCRLQSFSIASISGCIKHTEHCKYLEDSRYHNFFKLKKLSVKLWTEFSFHIQDLGADIYLLWISMPRFLHKWKKADYIFYDYNNLSSKKVFEVGSENCFCQ